MLAEYIASTGLGGLHLVALVIFFGAFVAVLVRLCLRPDAARDALLPFEPGELPPGAGKGVTS